MGGFLLYWLLDRSGASFLGLRLYVIQKCRPTSSVPLYAASHGDEEGKTDDGTPGRGNDHLKVRDGTEDAMDSRGRGRGSQGESLPGQDSGVGDSAGGASGVSGDRGLTV